MQYVPPPPPPNSRDTFCPPLSRCPNKHKQICGIVPGLAWVAKNIVYVFFFGSFLRREKHIRKIHLNPGTIPRKFCLRVFSLYVFFAPNLLRVVDLPSHCDLLSRYAPCADTIFLGTTDICRLKEGLKA